MWQYIQFFFYCFYYLKPAQMGYLRRSLIVINTFRPWSPSLERSIEKFTLKTKDDLYQIKQKTRSTFTGLRASIQPMTNYQERSLISKIICQSHSTSASGISSSGSPRKYLNSTPYRFMMRFRLVSSVFLRKKRSSAITSDISSSAWSLNSSRFSCALSSLLS